ncbi:MAG: M23 family metallopeptidase [Clostridiales bacterium]|nr:M23 family metallopeptidase [Clostridiales bacterium]
MKARRKRYRNRNKKWGKMLLMTGIAVFIIFILFNFLGRFIPSEEEKKAEDYKKAAEMAGCTWQELVTYDTVRYENNLKNVNPYLSAVDFVKMYYEIYNYVETENGGYWALVSGGTLSDSSSIWSWFGLDSGSDLNAVLKASKKYQKPEFVIRFSPKELNDLIIEKGFSEKQIQWLDRLMTSGSLDEMMGSSYALPDYIESAEQGYFAWPTPALHVITSKFASARKHPVFGITRAHNGVDISGDNAEGSPVVAIDNGVVISVDLNGGERGINIKVQHNIGNDIWISRYQHLSTVQVAEGQSVTKNTTIGTVGNTGVGTGPHLHLELTYNGVLIDPLLLIVDK